MKSPKKDILGKTPKLYDIIAYNPPSYKGLVHGLCIGFTNAGLPKVDMDTADYGNYSIKYHMQKNGYYTPKTGFVCIDNPLTKDRE
jgi:hypothetical protein